MTARTASRTPREQDSRNFGRSAQEGPHPAPGHRILAFFLAALVAIPLLLLAGGAWYAWRRAWAEASAEVTRAAEAAAEYLQRVLEGHELRIARAEDLLRGLTEEEIRARESRLHEALVRIVGQQPDGRWPLTLFAHARDGTLLLSATAFPVPRDACFADREFIRALRDPATPEPHLSSVHLGRLDGRPFFSLSHRRHGGADPPAPDGYEGVIQVAVYVDAASTAMRQFLQDPHDVISFVRSDGEVLARTRDHPTGLAPMRLATESPMRAIMARGDPRALVNDGRSTPDGVVRIAAYRRVDGWPVYASAARPASAIAARWRQVVLAQLAIGLPASALLIGMAGAVWRRQKALAAANAVLEQGVAARTAELADSLVHLTLAQEAARIGTWETDFATGEVRWSAEQWRLLGLDPQTDGPASNALFFSRVHPDDVPLLDAAERRARETGRYDAEFRIREPGPSDRGEAGWRWLLARGRVVSSPGAAALRIVGVNLDITDRRRSEEKLALVAREAAHRAKNALHLVSAAVRLTSAATVQEFAAIVEGRVAAVARAQSIVAEGGGRGANLRLVAEAALSQLLPLGNGRIELSGPNIWLGGDAVQPISMALHELTTNAVKYGALSVPAGRVRLGWTITAPAGTLRLCWEERDGPRLAVPPEREGFGSSVVSATLGSQLGGAVTRDWRPEGLVLVAVLPLAMLVPAAHEPEPQPRRML